MWALALATAALLALSVLEGEGLLLGIPENRRTNGARLSWDQSLVKADPTVAHCRNPLKSGDSNQVGLTSTLRAA